MAQALSPQYAAFAGDEATAFGEERVRSDATALPDLEGTQSRDAIAAMVEAATDKQIVILNEAHNVSGRRSFAAGVVRALRHLGFDTFAAETFIQPQEDAAPTMSVFKNARRFMAGWASISPILSMPRWCAKRRSWGYVFAD